MGKILKIAMVEDKETCANQLKEQLKRYELERGYAFELSEFDSVEHLLTEYKRGYDIVLMDIMLPGMNGMEGARELRKMDPVVTLIFITNMAQFAVQSYEVEALDYLLKPVTYKNFSVKMDRAIRVISRKEDKKITVFGKEKIYVMSVSDILYVEVRGHHLLFYKTDGLTVDVCGSLSDIQEQLQGSAFSRCNSCYLVNMRYINRVEGYDIILSNGETLQISKRKRKDFVDDLTAYLAGS